jgi:Na+/H+-translocating membrane pyrophosphatase
MGQTLKSSNCHKHYLWKLALGYKSVIILGFANPAAIYLSFSLADMYGITVAAHGMFSTLATGLAIDAYMVLSVTMLVGLLKWLAMTLHQVHETTDAFDAAAITSSIGTRYKESALAIHVAYSLAN